MSILKVGFVASIPALFGFAGGVLGGLFSDYLIGRGHVRVGDSSWPVIADEDFAAGSKVEVIAVEGITLRIRPAVR
ncbi:Putative activity regulator of membrane protease YbbK [Klebsiella pneumoniae IS43]|uniref:Activity regulator of membrane protease YbbK n=1 Tax=Klebsiella pneumoniae IS43 TaxID=1432552 RepID=W1DVW1_KLEPN|nr:Putative activity regulator of membrane protease YbbK [Klebsiella pneumoniae IS43]